MAPRPDRAGAASPAASPAPWVATPSQPSAAVACSSGGALGKSKGKKIKKAPPAAPPAKHPKPKGKKVGAAPPPTPEEEKAVRLLQNFEAVS